MTRDVCLKRHIFIQCAEADCGWIGRGIRTDDGIRVVGVTACTQCGSTTFHELTASRLDADYGDNGDEE